VNLRETILGGEAGTAREDRGIRYTHKSKGAYVEEKKRVRRERVCGEVY